MEQSISPRITRISNRVSAFLIQFAWVAALPGGEIRDWPFSSSRLAWTLAPRWRCVSLAGFAGLGSPAHKSRLIFLSSWRSLRLGGFRLSHSVFRPSCYPCQSVAKRGCLSFLVPWRLGGHVFIRGSLLRHCALCVKFCAVFAASVPAFLISSFPIRKICAICVICG